MTQTLPQITEVIPLAPDFPGTVYTAWSPRPDSQSPDINPPSGEFVSLASFFVHEADAADPCTDWSAAETVPVIDLAAVMPLPVVEDHTPLWAQGRHRRLSHVAPWVWVSLGAGVFAPVIVVAWVSLLAVVL